MIDFASGFPKRASSRLRKQIIVWLTTVDGGGSPQPRPVWFHWDGSTFLIFSQPGAAKVRQIRRNPAVAINLNSDPDGDEVTVMLGVARMLPSWPKGPRVDQYLRKYRAGMKALGFTSDTFKAEYNTPIEVTPTEVRGF